MVPQTLGDVRLWGKKRKGELMGTLALRAFKNAGCLGEVLREDLDRIFISFMLMCQNEIHSLNFLCPWLWLANSTN